MIDPQTGAGAYLVNSASNGGLIDFFGEHSTAIGFVLFIAGLLAGLAGGIWPIAIGIIALFAVVMVFEAAYLEAVNGAECEAAIHCIQNIMIVLFLIQIVLLIAGVFAEAILAVILGAMGLIFADDLAKAAARACNTLGCHNPVP